MVDLMIAVRMTRKRPDQARLRAALVEGYRQHRALEGADLEVLGALGVVSLNMGLAWCHSRRALPRVQKSLPAIIKFTLEANRRYLEGQDPLAPPLPAA
jgi:Ser/Thr protein kinase RdoA (MazF antagonist)